MTTAASPPALDAQHLMDVLRAALQEAARQITPPDPELQLYTPAEAAELLKVTENWVTERIKARRIPCTFVGEGRFPRLSAAHIRAITAMGEVDPATHGRRKKLR